MIFWVRLFSSLMSFLLPLLTPRIIPVFCPILRAGAYGRQHVIIDSVFVFGKPQTRKLAIALQVCRSSRRFCGCAEISGWILMLCFQTEKKRGGKNSELS
jgi:hypothetical protein